MCCSNSLDKEVENDYRAVTAEVTALGTLLDEVHGQKVRLLAWREVVNLRAKNEHLWTEGKRLALRDLADERAVLGRRADLETHSPAEPRSEDVPKNKTSENLRAHRRQQRRDDKPRTGIYRFYSKATGDLICLQRGRIYKEALCELPVWCLKC